VVHLPSFAPQQNVNPLVAIANPSLSQLSNPDPQGGLIVPRRFIPVRRSKKQEHPDIPAVHLLRGVLPDAAPTPVDVQALEFF
jgi:hypothetical protein